MLYRVANCNSATETTYSEKEANSLIERQQHNFSKPLQRVPVEAEGEGKPRLWLVKK